MSQSTMTYILSYIMQNIPREILDLAFKPTQFNTSIEARIISEVIEGPVLLDSNLVGGRRREIFLNQSWMLDLNSIQQVGLVGTGVQGSYYKVPPEAREYRNISSVIGIVNSMTSSLPGSSMNFNGAGSFGNTASGMLSQMVNTRTFGMFPIIPQATLEGTNIIMFFPQQVVEGAAVSVMLENDSEFLNMSPSGIMAMRKFCLCAVQRYIANKLRVSIDESQIVGGMEIGVVKDLVNEYAQKAESYEELLIKVKGAAMYDRKSLTKIIYLAI